MTNRVIDYLEYHDDIKNSHKFYLVINYKTNDEYIVRWGRIGTKGQYKIYNGYNIIYDKINEKINKGYTYTHPIPEYLLTFNDILIGDISKKEEHIDDNFMKLLKSL